MATEETKIPDSVIPVTDEQPPAAAEEAEKAAEVEKEAEKVVVEAGPEKITQSVSFKEETNVVVELPESQRKSLDELKKLIQDALAKREFSTPPVSATIPPLVKEEEKKQEVVVEKTAEEAPPSKDDAVVSETIVSSKEAQEKEDVVVPPSKDDTVISETTVLSEEPPKEEKDDVVAPPPSKDETVVSETIVSSEEPPKIEEEAQVVTEDEVKKATSEDIKETIIEVVTPEAGDVSVTKIEKTETSPASEPEEVSIWGIPLLAEERTDVILLKFLRARDFKVKEAFTMIRNAVRWRKEFGVDDLLSEDLGKDYEKVLFTHGYDKQGRIVCYNVFGEFQNKELYQNTFSDAEKRNKFLKWLIQFLENIIRDLDFSPNGINSIVLVNDLKNSPGYGKRDVSKIIDKFLGILQDNYPEFVAKQVCINTSWWYVAYYWVYLTVFTPRSKSKFVFASPSKTPETLFKYIAPEHVPVQYGGHSKIGDTEFSAAHPVSQVVIKPGCKHPIEFAFSEAAELVWELRVIGWDVTYGAEFLPVKEGGYTLNISKPKKILSSTDEPVITDMFKVTEAGKVVITIDNQSSKKKKLLYRSKVKPSSE